VVDFGVRLLLLPLLSEGIARALMRIKHSQPRWAHSEVPIRAALLSRVFLRVRCNTDTGRVGSWLQPHGFTRMNRLAFASNATTTALNQAAGRLGRPHEPSLQEFTMHTLRTLAAWSLAAPERLRESRPHEGDAGRHRPDERQLSAMP